MRTGSETQEEQSSAHQNLQENLLSRPHCRSDVLSELLKKVTQVKQLSTRGFNTDEYALF